MMHVFFAQVVLNIVVIQLSDRPIVPLQDRGLQLCCTIKPGLLNGFFHLQVAGEAEVKAQVKLMLKDVSGERVIATRSLVSTQKVHYLDLGLCNKNINMYNLMNSVAKWPKH